MGLMRQKTTNDSYKTHIRQLDRAVLAALARFTLIAPDVAAALHAVHDLAVFRDPKSFRRNFFRFEFHNNLSSRPPSRDPVLF